MEDQYLYFPVSGKDESWGLKVLNVGNTNIKKRTPYPPAGHPAHHQFNWEAGRVLQEYQLIYITRGSGIFESEKCRKPTIANLFNDIVQTSVQEKPGYQSATSGAIIHLLALLHARRQQSSLSEIDLEEMMVTRARIIFRESLYQKISPEEVAEQLQVGYSWFRKVFKKFTGLAPGQYLIQLKIQKAKEMLADPARQIKEIAYDLNLESPLYFSKLFKGKTGISPLAYRKQLSGNNSC
jgi:AraC-like DNA-binding protein